MFWFVDCEFGNQHEVPVTHYWGTFIWSGEGFDDADIWWPHCRRRLCLRLQSLQANVTPLQSVMKDHCILISSCPSKLIQLSIHCAVHWVKKIDDLENPKLTRSDSNFSKTLAFPGIGRTDRNLVQVLLVAWQFSEQNRGIAEPSSSSSSSSSSSLPFWFPLSQCVSWQLKLASLYTTFFQACFAHPK